MYRGETVFEYISDKTSCDHCMDNLQSLDDSNICSVHCRCSWTSQRTHTSPLGAYGDFQFSKFKPGTTYFGSYSNIALWDNKYYIYADYCEYSAKAKTCP